MSEEIQNKDAHLKEIEDNKTGTTKSEDNHSVDPKSDTEMTDEEKQDEDKMKQPEKVEMVEIPKKRLEELENAEAKFFEDLKRERAEGINYRKRLQKQREEFAEIASARVLSKLLAVQDDLKRLLDNGKESIPKNHYEGIELLSQRVEGIFDSEGVSLIKVEEGKTRYDPMLHEAVVSQPIPDVEPNTIVGVINQGFKKGDRVLRPVKVMISQATPKPKAVEEDKQKDEQTDVSEANKESRDTASSEEMANPEVTDNQ